MVQLFHMQQVGKSVNYSTYFLKINYNKYVNAICGKDLAFSILNS